MISSELVQWAYLYNADSGKMNYYSALRPPKSIINKEAYHSLC